MYRESNENPETFPDQLLIREYILFKNKVKDYAEEARGLFKLIINRGIVEELRECESKMEVKNVEDK
jgi:hypothetical protein